MSNKAIKTGVELISEERQRQIDQLGYSPSDDQEYKSQELSHGAKAFIEMASLQQQEVINPSAILDHVNMMYWPGRWRRIRTLKSPLESLIRAGAMIAAEIDRLQYKEPSK